MTLIEAIAQWLEAMARDDSGSQECAESRALSLAWLVRYADKKLCLKELTPARLRDFLARWFVEQTGIPAQRVSGLSSSTGRLDATTLMDSLTEFIDWAASDLAFAEADECLAVLSELRDRLPRALAISERLSEHLAGRGGAFGFPEFLTSFEAGGHSQYDLDTAGKSGCMEGYFRILRVEGPLVEAEEVITETRLWPVPFPEHVATLLENDYIINLELIQVENAWQIMACGFAYPPGTVV